MILLSVSLPVLVQQWEQGSIQRFRKVFLWNAGSMLAITAIPLMVIALSSTWIMGLYGAGFRDGKTLLILMVIAAPTHALTKMASTALLSMNRAWSVFWLNVIWGVAMLVFALLLIPTWGALGLAISFLTTYCFLMFLTTALVFFYLHVGKPKPLLSPARNV